MASNSAGQPASNSTNGVKDLAGTTVTFYGWGGDEKTNAWIDGFLTDVMKSKYDIKLKRVGMDIDQILNQLLSEKQANLAKGNIDVIWINGENFYTAKSSGLLYGPIAHRVDNYQKYIDGANTENTTDFGVPTEGFEVPYGRAQLVMIKNSEVFPEPITSAEKLMELAKAKPGLITYPAPPDFTGSAFVRTILCDIVGYEEIKAAGADKAKLKAVLAPAMAYLKELKPYLWKAGTTYPADVASLNNMYADNEVALTVSYTPFFVVDAVAQGFFTESSQVSVFDKGSVGNTHFVSLAYNSPNPEGGIALINEILSVEAQARKYVPAVWGDLSVLDFDKLSPEEQAQFKAVPTGDAAMTQEELMNKRIPELPAEMIPIIEEIWMEEIPG